MQYKDFVKKHMAGKSFKSREDANAHMKKISMMWKEEKAKMEAGAKVSKPKMGKKGKGMKAQSLIGDIAGEVLSGASNLARKYL